MIPCGHETKQPDTCGLCWKFCHQREYNLAWGGDGNVTPGVPWWGKAVNFGGAVLKHIADGMAKTPPEELAKREELCQACEFFVNNECGKCGCPMLAKAAWRSEKCPVGKW